MVTDREPWSEDTAAWLREAAAAGLPMFGVCYGHQLLAHALGGKVGYNPTGSELGTQTVELLPPAAGDQLLDGLPASFPAQMLHAQTVLQPPPARPCWPGPTRIRTRCSASARTCSRPSSTPNSARTSCAPTWNATSASTWRKT